MDAFAAYKQASFSSTTRIDLLIALYDGAIERLELARGNLADGNKNESMQHLTRAQLIVAAIVSGIRTQVAPEITVSIMRLCEFVAYQITQSTVESLSSALDVLKNLRNGFAKIRPEAASLERTGQIPHLDAINGIQAVA